MTLLGFTLVALLSQAELPAAERAALAAEKAAAAAERAALAAEKAAEAAARTAQGISAPVVPPVVAPVPPEAEGPPANPWTASVSIGLIMLTGNAESLTGTAAAEAEKKLDGWKVGFKANGAYGQSRAPGTTDEQVTALRALFSARLDRAIVSFATVYALAGADTDHVKSIEARGFGELGTSITFLERKETFENKELDFERVLVRADLGFRVSHETRFQYYADATVPAGTALPAVTNAGPRIGAVFRYALNKGVRFSEEVEFLPNVLGPSRFLFTSNTRLNAALTTKLSVGISFLVNFDSAPPASKQQTDTALTLGLEAAL